MLKGRLLLLSLLFWIVLSNKVEGSNEIAFGFCFDKAAQLYGLNAELLKAIAKVESNFNPAAVHYNKNGTYDYGLMQINSSWYSVLGRERWLRLGDPCYNILVGAWILKNCILQYGYIWRAVGCYHSPNLRHQLRYINFVRQVINITKDGKN